MQGLVDLDLICYRSGFASDNIIWRVYLEGEEQYGPMASFEGDKAKKQAEEWINGAPELILKREVEPEPLEYCLRTVRTSLESALEGSGATSHQGYLTGDNQFRKKIATIKPYKGNRDPLHKPFWYREIRQYLVDKWNAKVVDYYEADDMLCMEQWKDWKHVFYLTGNGQEAEYNTIIISGDKDLNQCPSWHYSIYKKEKYFVSLDQADRFLYEQILSGDVTDNVGGIYGYGPEKAKKALYRCKNNKEMYEVVRALYQKHYKEKADEVLTEMANLIYIIREEGKHWTPPTS